MPDNFYVYMYIDPRGNVPLYVGKGQKGRAYYHWKYGNRYNRLLQNKLNAIRKCGIRPWIIFPKQDISEDEAFELERQLIEVFGRIDRRTGTLCNMTDGGDGISGAVISSETRRKQGLAHKGKVITEEQRNKISISLKGRFKGRILSDEWKQKISNSLKGNIPWNKGIPRDVAVTKKITEKRIGKKLTQEQKQRISDSLKGEKCYWFGKTLSEEHKRKLSDARKGRHFKKECQTKAG